MPNWWAANQTFALIRYQSAKENLLSAIDGLSTYTHLIYKGTITYDDPRIPKLIPGKKNTVIFHHTREEYKSILEKKLVDAINPKNPKEINFNLIEMYLDIAQDIFKFSMGKIDHPYFTTSMQVGFDSFFDDATKALNTMRDIRNQDLGPFYTADEYYFDSGYNKDSRLEDLFVQHRTDDNDYMM